MTQERAAFELWAGGRGLPIGKDREGTYHNIHTRDAFDAWKAAIASVRAAPNSEEGLQK